MIVFEYHKKVTVTSRVKKLNRARRSEWRGNGRELMRREEDVDEALRMMDRERQEEGSSVRVGAGQRTLGVEGE